jgi:DNA-binding CsgD family transcriptional regulator
MTTDTLLEGSTSVVEEGHPSSNPGDGPDLEHLLGRALAACERVLRLPSIPVHDWCSQAAAALSPLAPGGAVIVLVAPLEQGGRIGALRATGVWSARGAHPSAPPPSAEELRCGVEGLRGRPWCLPDTLPGWCGLIEPERLRLMGRGHDSLWAWGEGVRVVAGAQPLPGSDATVIVYLAGCDLDRSAALALHAVLETLCAQVTRTLRNATLEPKDWVSPREQEVLDGLILGRTVREIAEYLGRSPHTIHDHVKNLHRKLHASTRGELVARALGHAGTDRPPTPPAPDQGST